MKAVLFALLAGLCWGLGELFTKSVLHSGKVGPITAIAVRSTVALPVLWLAYFLIVHVGRAEPRGWLRADASILLKLVLGSGLAAGALGMIFFYSAMHLGEISRVKPIAFTVAPATAVMLGMLALHEEVTWQKMLASGLVLAGVILFAAK